MFIYDEVVDFAERGDQKNSSLASIDSINVPDNTPNPIESNSFLNP